MLLGPNQEVSIGFPVTSLLSVQLE